jgi:hypothetical protein
LPTGNRAVRESAGQDADDRVRVADGLHGEVPSVDAEHLI